MTNTGSDFTIESVLAELREIALAARDANEGVDYVYTNPNTNGPTCLYVHGDEQGCLIGRWLHSKGVSLIDLARFEGDTAKEIVPRFFPMTDHSVLAWLDIIQDRQDVGVPWLSLVDYFISKFGS